MTQIDITPDHEALSILVRQDGRPRGTGLAHHVSGARVVEEAVVDAARVPRVDALRAAKRRVADKRMAATVVVAGVEVSAAMIFLEGKGGSGADSTRRQPGRTFAQ